MDNDLISALYDIFAYDVFDKHIVAFTAKFSVYVDLGDRIDAAEMQTVIFKGVKFGEIIDVRILIFANV